MTDMIRAIQRCCVTKMPYFKLNPAGSLSPNHYDSHI